MGMEPSRFSFHVTSIVLPEEFGEPLKPETRKNGPVEIVTSKAEVSQSGEVEDRWATGALEIIVTEVQRCYLPRGCVAGDTLPVATVGALQLEKRFSLVRMAMNWDGGVGNSLDGAEGFRSSDGAWWEHTSGLTGAG
uniref:Uncharacterized protein n=1 Tax=Oryza rufipogon TaxID=4529 RepID=A0A0E0MRP0_ORYRU